MTAHDFEFESIDGDPLPMKKFEGHPVLIVNTASECGYTSQYQALQSLWSDYQKSGLIVLGVPCNDFGNQEPGDDIQIKQFCDSNFGVDFPMTKKVSVLGDDAHPFYRWVESEFGEAAAPRWNFHKYLVGPDGALVGMWPSEVEPLSDEIVNAVKELL